MGPATVWFPCQNQNHDSTAFQPVTQSLRCLSYPGFCWCEQSRFIYGLHPKEPTIRYEAGWAPELVRLYVLAKRKFPSSGYHQNTCTVADFTQLPRVLSSCIIGACDLTVLISICRGADHTVRHCTTRQILVKYHICRLCLVAINL